MAIDSLSHTADTPGNLLQRRRFLKALIGSTVSGTSALAMADSSLPVNKSSSNEQLSTPLASTFKQTDEKFGVAVMDADGQVAQRLELPARGHDCVFRPGAQELVVFARRPGTFMQVIDMQGVRPVRQRNSVAGRHFYGHGCFSKDGTLLYATENDYAAARGAIGIYDAQRNYERIGEFDTYGVGPHDIALQVDGRTLIVANGGIETHPNSGRDKLNLYDMQSNLSVIDIRTGQLLGQFVLPGEFQKLSLRHLALDERGDCYVGGQYEGAAEDQPPLTGSLRRNGEFQIWQAPSAVRAALKNYISSLCVVNGQSQLITSSARGGISVVWNTDSGKIDQVIEVLDGSGVGAYEHRLYISDGHGMLHNYTNESEEGWKENSTVMSESVHWDNHLAIGF